MERVKRTSDGLRVLVQDLDQKLEDARGHRTGKNPEIIIDLRTTPHGGLVSDLDKKLQKHADQRQPEIIPPRFSDRVPTWLGFVLVTLLGIALAVVVVRPWQPHCAYSSDFCQVAELDIDALRVTIPESDLIAALPNIDELDPNDELTAGDIFAMERFAHLDFEELITAEEVDRLLRPAG